MQAIRTLGCAPEEIYFSPMNVSKFYYTKSFFYCTFLHYLIPFTWKKIAESVLISLLQRNPWFLDPSLLLKDQYLCALRTYISLVVLLMIQILHIFLSMNVVLSTIFKNW